MLTFYMTVYFSVRILHIPGLYQCQNIRLYATHIALGLVNKHSISLLYWVCVGPVKSTL